MAISHFQDSAVSVTTQRNKNFCWAACIEMVTGKFSLQPIPEHFQCELAQKQVELLKGKKTIKFSFDNCLKCNSLGDTSLKRGRDLYLKLFEEICQIECTQFELKSFPSWKYIESQTAQGLPIIVSGIYIPSCFGASHAVVITGCFAEKNHLGQDVHWVLINDPYVPNPCQSQQARKTAWIYDELKASHEAAAGEDSEDGKLKRLIYVTDFRPVEQAPKGAEMKQKKVKSATRSHGAYPVFTDAELTGQVEALLKSLVDSEKESSLSNYFGFITQEEMKAKSLISYKSINGSRPFSLPEMTTGTNKQNVLQLTTNEKDVALIQNEINISVLPVYQGEKHIIDIYIQHEGADKNRIVGIQEHQSSDSIPGASIPSKDDNFEFNHDDHPNYSIVDIAPFGFRFMVFEQDGKTFYAPVANYPGIEAFCAQSQPESQLMGMMSEKLSSIYKGKDIHSF